MVNHSKLIRVFLFTLFLFITALCAVTFVSARGDVSPRVISVSDYGTAGDGVTDDTPFILQAIGELQDGDTLLFPAGTYLVREHGSMDILLISELKDLTVILEDGAIIQLDTVADGRLPHGNRHSVFHFHRCENLTVMGGAIYGDLLRYTGFTHVEQGVAIRLSDCRKVMVQQVETAYFRGDGIRVFSVDLDENGNHLRCYDVTIDNCHVHDCFRNGITLTSVVGCRISHTEVHGIRGTAPEAAIDIEAEYAGSYNHNVTVENCHFYDNGAIGVAISGRAENIAVLNSVLEQRIVLGAKGTDLTVQDCTVDFVGIYGKKCVIENTELGYVGLYGGEVTCKDCRFDGKGWIPYRVLITKSDRTSIGRFESCTFRGRGLCALGGCIVFCHTPPAEMTFTDCTFRSCGLIPFLGHLDTTEREGCFFDLGWALWLCITAAAALITLLILRRRRRVWVSKPAT